MILGKIIIDGPDQGINEALADAMFDFLKKREHPAIFIKDYEDKPNVASYILGDTFVVAIRKRQAPITRESAARTRPNRGRAAK